MFFEQIFGGKASTVLICNWLPEIREAIVIGSHERHRAIQ